MYKSNKYMMTVQAYFYKIITSVKNIKITKNFKKFKKELFFY